MEFIRSNLIRDRTSATEIIERDLPINPLSHLILSMSACNVTNEWLLTEALPFLNSVEVTRSGVTVINLQSEDLYGLNCYLYRKRPQFSQKVATDNATRTLGFIIPFGRRIFDPDECFPATKKGDLTIRINTTVIGTSADQGIWSLEAVEMPGANPSHHLRAGLHVIAAPGATGDNDVDLPIGNEIIALQLRMTTFPATDSHVYGVENARVLVDNKEFGYAAARAQCLVADGIFRLDGQSGDIAAAGSILPVNQVWLDYDPHGDGNWLLDTKGKSSVKLRLNMGVNEATNLTVIERVAL